MHGPYPADASPEDQRGLIGERHEQRRDVVELGLEGEQAHDQKTLDHKHQMQDRRPHARTQPDD